MRQVYHETSVLRDKSTTKQVYHETSVPRDRGMKLSTLRSGGHRLRSNVAEDIFGHMAAALLSTRFGQVGFLVQSCFVFKSGVS